MRGFPHGDIFSWVRGWMGLDLGQKILPPSLLFLVVLVPKVYLTAINQHFGKLEVFGYHLVNILIHILTSILWFFLVKKLLGIEPLEKRFLKENLPLLCSAIHLLNPLNIQAVTIFLAALLY